MLLRRTQCIACSTTPQRPFSLTALPSQTTIPFVNTTTVLSIPPQTMRFTILAAMTSHKPTSPTTWLAGSQP